MKQKLIKSLLIIISVGFLTAAILFYKTQTEMPITPNIMKITSSAFGHKQKIPSKHTCDGENISPNLKISDVPEKAQSIALIMDDPDAPSGTWVHWTAWNLPPSDQEIAENSFPNDAIEGTTSFKKTGYGGPCPPSGQHRYFFKVYALDTKLDLAPSATKEIIEAEMKGHILDKAELIGLYERNSA